MLRTTLVSPKNFITEELPDASAGAGEVLIEIKRMGICGSDIHAYYGEHPFVPAPITLGHEFSGVVTALGEGVKNIKIGDRVTAMPQIYCGECYNCKIGRYNICSSLTVIGCQCAGAGQKLLPVNSRLIIKLPDAMSMDRGAMLEPAAVGVHACKRAGGVKDKKIIVMGAGTIGNLTAQSALAMGAASVIITDKSAHRLELAKQCGISHTATPESLRARVAENFGADGADIIIECVGVGETVDQAVQIARKGTDIVIAGVFGKCASVDMGLVQDKELRLTGTLMYTAESWRDAMDFFASGAMNPDPLVSKRFKYNEFAGAFKYIEDNRETAVKVLVEN